MPSRRMTTVTETMTVTATATAPTLNFALIVPFAVFLLARVHSVPTEIHRGLSISPDPSMSSPGILLADGVDNFSLAFLRLEGSKLALAVIHTDSSVPVWRAALNRPVRWSPETTLTFNGSLTIKDAGSVVWSTGTNGRLLRLRHGNLQILGRNSIHWQSFDFTTDTLLVNQNFTEKMTLQSSNGLYSMRIQKDYLGLYAEFKPGSGQLYWKRTAMQAKAQIVDGLGPIYARIDPAGFLGVYQTEAAPVDVIAFSSYYRAVPGTRRLRLESDGNLRGYFWNFTSWVVDFSAIQGACELPSQCGAYGLCSLDSGCYCLDERRKYQAGGCSPTEDGDFCGGIWENRYAVLTRRGVDLRYKELVETTKAETEEGCRRNCENSCSCWGAIYSNVSGVCYTVDFPVRTVVESADEMKVGFFKVKQTHQRSGFADERIWVLCVVIGSLGIVVVAPVACAAWRWRKRRWAEGFSRKKHSAGPYADLRHHEGIECARR